VIWDVLHKAIRKGEPYPISLDEAVQVMRVVSAVRASSIVNCP
jgi:hypothetical protein